MTPSDYISVEEIISSANEMSLKYRVHIALKECFEEWRGACNVEQDWDNDESPQARWWKCHACQDTFVFERGFSPTYCPNCGRKVVKGDA